MATKIITISREFGSGGRLIGQKVAERMGIPFYDRKLIELVAKESGYDLSFIEETGEYSTNGSFLYSLSISSACAYPQHTIYTDDSMPISDKLHLFQTKVIKDAAAKGPCVIVGRCADYILKDRTDCLNVLIHADIEEKRHRAIQYLGVEEKNVDRELKRKDKARANHYKRYTGRDWGNIQNYDLSVNSGTFDIDGSVELIVKAAGL